MRFLSRLLLEIKRWPKVTCRLLLLMIYNVWEVLKLALNIFIFNIKIYKIRMEPVWKKSNCRSYFWSWKKETCWVQGGHTPEGYLCFCIWDSLQCVFSPHLVLTPSPKDCISKLTVARICLLCSSLSNIKVVTLTSDIKI